MTSAIFRPHAFGNGLLSRVTTSRADWVRRVCSDRDRVRRSVSATIHLVCQGAEALWVTERVAEPHLSHRIEGPYWLGHPDVVGEASLNAGESRIGRQRAFACRKWRPRDTESCFGVRRTRGKRGHTSAVELGGSIPVDSNGDGACGCGRYNVGEGLHDERLDGHDGDAGIADAVGVRVGLVGVDDGGTVVDLVSHTIGVAVDDGRGLDEGLDDGGLFDDGLLLLGLGLLGLLVLGRGSSAGWSLAEGSSGRLVLGGLLGRLVLGPGSSAAWSSAGLLGRPGPRPGSSAGWSSAGLLGLALLGRAPGAAGPWRAPRPAAPRPGSAALKRSLARAGSRPSTLATRRLLSSPSTTASAVNLVFAVVGRIISVSGETGTNYPKGPVSLDALTTVVCGAGLLVRAEGWIGS